MTDAELMVKAFSPTFTAEDLTKTPNFAAVTKVMMFDMPSAPFTINLPPPMGEPNDDLMKTLKVYSATKYAKTRAEVEQEIQDRWNSANKAKEAESASSPNENMSLGPTGSPQDAFSDVNGINTASGSNASPSGSDGASGGFLDKWLSKQDD